LTKELAIGALNGLLWALVVASIAGVWFQSARLGLLLGSAMMINLICAAGAGALIPMVGSVGIDALAGGGVDDGDRCRRFYGVLGIGFI
jgi:magnesium transporter